MKNLIPAVILLGLIIVSCGGDNILISERQEPVLRLTGVGSCEPNTTRRPVSTSLKDVFSPELGSQDRLKLEVQQGRVSFSHWGATLNCCMDSLLLALKREGYRLCVMETEHAASRCDCECDYIVYGEIVGLSPGTCTIEIRNTAAPESVLCAVRVTVP